MSMELGIDLSPAIRRLFLVTLHRTCLIYSLCIVWDFLNFIFLTQQKAPDSGELIIMGIDAAKPFAEVGVVSGMLLIV